METTWVIAAKPRSPYWGNACHIFTMLKLKGSPLPNDPIEKFYEDEDKKHLREEDYKHFRVVLIFDDKIQTLLNALEMLGNKELVREISYNISMELTDAVKFCDCLASAAETKLRIATQATEA